MKVLVTGASGFVGSHLCERLEQLGYNVYAQARDPAKLAFWRVPGIPVIGKLFHDQRHSWVDELPNDLEGVVHVAGLVHSFEEQDFFSTNAWATERLINDLSQKYDHLKFILISSLAAVGPSENSLLRREEHRPAPVCAYGRSKLKAEELLASTAPKEWKKIIVRPPIVLGPRDEGFLEIFRFVKKGLVPMVGLGSKDKEYSYICIYDLIEAIHHLLKYSPQQEEAFFVSYPKTVMFEELVENIARKMHVKKPFVLSLPSIPMKWTANILKRIHRLYPINVRLTPDKYQELIATAWTCSSEKSLSVPGVKYSWDLEETIEVTLQDYQKRGKL